MSYRFFNRGTDEPFVFNEVDDSGTPIATISADLIADNLQFISGYIENTTQFDITTNPPTILSFKLYLNMLQLIYY